MNCLRNNIHFNSYSLYILKNNLKSTYLYRNYSKSRYEEIQKLREGYNNSAAEENDFSKEIMDRIKNRRREHPSIHDTTTSSSDVYSSKREQTIEKKNDELIINGRKVSLNIPKDQVEIVSMKDY